MRSVTESSVKVFIFMGIAEETFVVLYGMLFCVLALSSFISAVSFTRIKLVKLIFHIAFSV
jgi:hypothetical protein